MHYRNSLARKWDQSRIETQQGKHHILQLHAQHLGLVIYHLGYKGLRVATSLQLCCFCTDSLSLRLVLLHVYSFP